MESEATQAGDSTRKQLRKRKPKPALNHPKYCGPHSTGKGYVWRGRKQIYFPGLYNSIESRDAYSAYCRQLLGVVPEVPPRDEVSVMTLMGRFKAEKLPKIPASQQPHFNSILRIAVEVYGLELASDFGPLKLQKFREILCQQKVGQPRSKKGAEIAARRKFPAKEQNVWARKYVNAQTRRVIRIFKWGVSAELIDEKLWRSLESIEPLREGESTARETDQVTPADYTHVALTRAKASPPIATMIEVQRLTGMRSSNVCDMRACDIDQSGEIWSYVPARHKSKWRKKKLFVALGPRAQALLKPFIISRGPTEYLFTPAESAQWQSEKRWAERKTPKWESAAKKRGKTSPLLQPKYSSNSYRQAIAYAAKRADVPIWKPHQLRHSLGTEIRKKFGVEASRVSLGHAGLDATLIYAERDAEVARKVAREMG